MAAAAGSPGALCHRVSELRFDLDENVPTEVGRQLRSSGIDVADTSGRIVRVRETNWRLPIVQILDGDAG